MSVSTILNRSTHQNYFYPMTTLPKFLLRSFFFVVLFSSGMYDAFSQNREAAPTGAPEDNYLYSACFQLDPPDGLHVVEPPDAATGDYGLQFLNTSTTYSGVLDSLKITGPNKGYFSINSISLPYKVGVGFLTNEAVWHIHFQLPKYITQHVYSATLNIVTTNDSCSPKSVPLEMRVQTQSPDTVYDLFHAPVLCSEDATPGVEHLWKLRNTSHDTLAISGDYLITPDRPTWYIRQDALRNIAAPGDTLIVDVINTAEEKNLIYEVTAEIRLRTRMPPYYDSINITVANIWWPNSSGVSAPELPTWTLTANPNPMREPLHVALTGAGQAMFEVYDVLGNVVARSASRGEEWTWSGTSMTGQPVANGSFYLRAMVVEGGIESVRTLRIAVER